MGILIKRETRTDPPPVKKVLTKPVVDTTTKKLNKKK